MIDGRCSKKFPPLFGDLPKLCYRVGLHNIRLYIRKSYELTVFSTESQHEMMTCGNDVSQNEEGERRRPSTKLPAATPSTRILVLLQEVTMRIISTLILIPSLAWAFSAPRPVVEVYAAKAFAESSFPIGPDELIQTAKEILGLDIGLGTGDDGDCLADNFQFCASVVGPLRKEEYLKALGTFKLADSFDIESNFFGFTVSPVQPNRSISSKTNKRR
jgi:hypothetical protein